MSSSMDRRNAIWVTPWARHLMRIKDETYGRYSSLKVYTRLGNEILVGLEMCSMFRQVGWVMKTEISVLRIVGFSPMST